jgi:hypothetical protein
MFIPLKMELIGIDPYPYSLVDFLEAPSSLRFVLFEGFQANHHDVRAYHGRFIFVMRSYYDCVEPASWDS